jgi:hypothetical protein
MPPSDPYASHLPILQALEPRRVLEFGGGKFSTGCFLAMPQVKRLVTIETDPEWFNKLRKMFRDRRWVLRESVAGFKPTEFDLVLIDDGDNMSHRLNTIRWVLGQEHPRVVIHDAEVAQYRAELQNTDHWVYTGATPYTAVVLP